MNNNIHIFENQKLLAAGLADNFGNMILGQIQTREKINIAVSGGKTPKILFEKLAQDYSHLPWGKINFFWVDERCVPPEDRESNYGMTRRTLLDKVTIPKSNVHRILGEADPETEVKRYGNEINQIVYSKNIIPQFDWILLGLGEDGHIASLFPNSAILEKVNSISAIAIHPQTKQKRITLTLPVINQANKITFLVSGRSKAQMVQKIFLSDGYRPDLPASLVKPVGGEIEWFFDKDAAKQLT